jgi:hypothetical protein
MIAGLCESPTANEKQQGEQDVKKINHGKAREKHAPSPSNLSLTA